MGIKRIISGYIGERERERERDIYIWDEGKENGNYRDSGDYLGMIKDPGDMSHMSGLGGRLSWVSDLWNPWSPLKDEISKKIFLTRVWEGMPCNKWATR